MAGTGTDRHGHASRREEHAAAAQAERRRRDLPSGDGQSRILCTERARLARFTEPTSVTRYRVRWSCALFLNWALKALPFIVRRNRIAMRGHDGNFPHRTPGLLHIRASKRESVAEPELGSMDTPCSATHRVHIGHRARCDHRGRNTKRQQRSSRSRTCQRQIPHPRPTPSLCHIGGLPRRVAAPRRGIA